MPDLNKCAVLVLVLPCIAIALNAQVPGESQHRRPMNAIYWSVGGGATYIAFEYERLIFSSNSLLLSAGAGLGSALSDAETSYKTLPFHFSGNIGRRTSFFEFGLGNTLIFDHPDRDAVTYLILGYRLSLLKKRKIAFSFRLHLDIPFDYIDVVGGDPKFFPYGLGLGIAF
ncbi:MAG: hypothetical protein MUC78_02965 [Bacteroidales bacterium]|jgi:hypothetical protein|nr:hypothetical protein [Bacteroidales bacterium]